MKGDLCGALIEPSSACGTPLSSGQTVPWHTMSRTLAAERGSVSCAWLFQAEEFRDTIHMLLEWLSEAEQTLRFRGALPDDTEALRSLIDTHKVIHPPGAGTHATHMGRVATPATESRFCLETLDLM